VKAGSGYYLKDERIQDSIRSDTSSYAGAKTDTVKTIAGDTLTRAGRQKKMPSPQRATILSAVLPGLGQAYNNKYWKIPIIYSAGAGLYYLYDTQTRNYNKNLHDYWESEANNDPNDMSDKYYSNVQSADHWRSLALIFIGVLYVANVVDAMADAYFLQYDISDDLTVRLEPLFMPEFYSTNNNYSSCGIKISLHF